VKSRAEAGIDDGHRAPSGVCSGFRSDLKRGLDAGVASDQGAFRRAFCATLDLTPRLDLPDNSLV
jgi:hypothetical protein